MMRARRLWGLLPPIIWSAAANALPLGGGGAALDISVVRIFAALVLCLAAALGLALVIKARKGAAPSWRTGWLFGGVTGSRRITIVETRRATPFADICLVRCDGEEYLLLCGPSGQTVLRWPDGSRRDGEGREDVE